MKLTCPQCGAAFAPGNVNLALGLASCEACGSVHDLSKRRGENAAVVRTPADPAGITVVEGPSPSVSWSWRTAAVLFLILWCTIWDGILLVMFTTSLASGDYEILLFGSIHALVGVGVTWLTVASLVNRTTIALSADELTVEHGPVPWWGNRAVARGEIAQIYVTEVRGNKGSRTYSLFAEVERGHRVPLASGIASVGRARFLEDWLEQRLGLADRPVDGEHA